MGVSPLLQLDIDMINSFPVDYMHNVCLGVMRKLLNYWVGGNRNNVRLQSRQVNLISEKLLSIKQNIPSEINRKPRSLSELSRFKATEYRTFLLYTGIIVLKDVVDSRIYNHFLIFHFAIALLMSSEQVTREINSELASNILITFIEHGKKLYGLEFMIYKCRYTF